MLSDILFSLRALLRRPGLSLIALLTLALGIGGSVAVFSVLNAVVLEPLAYPDAERVVNIYREDPPITRGPVTKRDFATIREDLRDQLVLAGHEQTTYSVGAEQGAIRVLGQRITADFFSVFGLDPVRGRWLDAADQAGDTNGVVVSSGFWQRQFGGSDDAIGAELLLNGEPWTVVGIAPPTLNYPGGTDVWVPMRLAQLDAAPGLNFIHLSARLHAGASHAEVQARLNMLAARLKEVGDGENMSLELIRVQEALVSRVSDTLWMLMIAVSLVMLIVCANVGNLLLSRILAREHELATRAAIGANPSRLARQAILEALLLAGAGAICGTMLAAVALDALLTLRPPGLPRLDAVSLDLQVLAFAAGAALCTGLLCGSLPAVRASRIDFANVFRGRTDERGGRLSAGRSLIVVGEIALSMALLVAAGLLLTTMKRISDVDPGFDTRNLLTAVIALPAPWPAELNLQTVMAQVGRNLPILVELETRLASLPGVVEAGLIDAMPLSGTTNFNGTVSAPGVTFEAGREPIVEHRWVSPGYLRAIGVPLLAGESVERTGSPLTGPSGRPILINQALADLLWPGEPEEAVGKQMEVSAAPGFPGMVAGVVGNARQWSLDREASPEVYLPYSLGAPIPTTATIVLRTDVPPLTLVEPLRRAVAEVDAQVPVFNVRTMEQASAAGNARRAFAMTLLEVFAGVAAFVAAIGLYGVMAYAVARRTREVGVRMALGAERRRVLRSFLSRGMAMTLAGIGGGAVIALFFARLLQGLVWGIEITAPAIYLGAGALLAAVAFAAILLPAWRASRIAPMQALRHE